MTQNYELPSKQVITEKLKQVIDPEIGLNIVDLNMVKDIRIDQGNISITVALTVQGCPLSGSIENDVRNIVSKMDGVRNVAVQMTTMSKEELNSLSARLQEMRGKQSSGATGQAKDASAGIDRLDRKGIQNIIAVMSGKGGVGKSFVTSLIAIELRKQGYNVGILDADITGPSIAKVFGLSGKPYADEHGVKPKETESGVKVISMNMFLETPDTPVIWRGPIINGVIRQLFTDINWGDLHYMLIDLPPGTGDAPLTVFQSLPVDAVVIVSTPQDLAMLIVKKSLNMARQMNVPIAGIVENMSYIVCPKCSEHIQMFEELGIEKVAKELKVNFLGRLPFDPRANRFADTGTIEQYSSKETEEFAGRVKDEVLKLTGLTTTPIAWKGKVKIAENEDVQSTHSRPPPSAKPIELSDATFFDTVNKSHLMVVDFWAPWCAPCRKVSPILEELAGEYAGKVTFGKLNVDENPSVSGQFQVQSIPTILIFKDGNVVDGLVGASPKDFIESKIVAQIQTKVS